jgi:hypothetical protein
MDCSPACCAAIRSRQISAVAATAFSTRDFHICGMLANQIIGAQTGLAKRTLIFRLRQKFKKAAVWFG